MLEYLEMDADLIFVGAFVAFMAIIIIGGIIIGRKIPTSHGAAADEEEYVAPSNTPYGLPGATSIQHLGVAMLPGGSLDPHGDSASPTGHGLID